MYCPRCGQEQVSSQTKYCSRCGFLLELVGDLLAHDGFLPELAKLQKGSFLTKKNGVLFSVLWLIFFLLVVTPIAGILDLDEISGVAAIIGIFGSVILMLASLVLLRSSLKAPIPLSPHQRGQISGGVGASLPPIQDKPARAYTAPHGDWRSPDTGPMKVPNSVTENTTKLLDKNEVE